MNVFLFHSIIAMSAFLIIFHLQRMLLKEKSVTTLILLGIGCLGLYAVIVLGLNQLSGSLKNMIAQSVFLLALSFQLFALKFRKSPNEYEENESNGNESNGNAFNDNESHKLALQQAGKPAIGYVVIISSVLMGCWLLSLWIGVPNAWIFLPCALLIIASGFFFGLRLLRTQ